MVFRQKKYCINPVKLTYEEVRIKRSKRFMAAAFWFIAVTAFTLFSGFLLSHTFGSKESYMLEARLDSLTLEMNKLYDRGSRISESLRSEIFVNDNTYRMILDLDTLPYSVRNAGRGGSAALSEMANHDELSYRLRDLIMSLDNQLKIQSVSFKALYERAQEYSILNTHVPAIQPVAKEDLTMISSDFGIRNDPFVLVERYHSGLDFVAPVGKNVHATGDGTVTFVQYSRTGYGNEIVIDHKFGFASRYAHLESIKVKEGERVKRGQVIGTTGETGRATGPHLHYEVLYYNHPVNPSYYFDTTLTCEEFKQIINKAN